MLNIRNIIALRTRRSKTPGASAFVSGYYEPADGGGGAFVWTNDTTSLDDGGIVIVPDSTPRKGCWKRVFDNSINVKWFGARGDNQTDDTDAFQAMFNGFNRLYFSYGSRYDNVLNTSRTRSFYVPAGSYIITRTLGFRQYPGEGNEARTETERLPFDIKIYGDNRAASKLKFKMEEGVGLCTASYEESNANVAVNFFLSDIDIQNQRNNALQKTIGLKADAGACIYISDCIFTNWSNGIWLDGTIYATIERIAFTGGTERIPDFSGVVLGHEYDPDRAAGWDSNAVIAIRDCTFLWAVPDSIGIKVWGCNMLDIQGNYFQTFKSIEVHDTGSLNIMCNGAERDYGIIDFKGGNRNVNIFQNQLHCGEYAILVQDTATIFCLSLANNFFSVSVAAVSDVFDKIVVVNQHSNILSTTASGYPAPLFKRSNPLKQIAANDTWHDKTRDLLAFALRHNVGNVQYPFYSISGSRNPDSESLNNQIGSIITWTANIGLDANDESGLGKSGEIRYIREFIYDRTDNTWIPTVEHHLASYAITHFELKGTVASELFDDGRSFIIKGLFLGKGGNNRLVRQQIMEDIKSSDDLPDLADIVEIVEQDSKLVVRVKGVDYDHWLISLTVTQRLLRYKSW